MHMEYKKQAFTLVELIVVITILAILWTIAFISLQWYSASSRDSVRLSDMSNIKTSLELYQVTAWKYVETTDSTEITFSWTTAWNQGIFWETSFKSVDKLDKIPKDPLTWKEYTYSLTSNKQEYQIAGIFEWSENASLLNNTYAAEKTATLRITWNYNGQILKVPKNTVTYILAVPSLITSTWGILEDIIQNKKLLFNWFKNLPLNYANSSFKQVWETGWDLDLVTPWNLIVYEWSIEDLKTDVTKRTELVTNLKLAYNGTDIETEPLIVNLVLVDTKEKTEVAVLWANLLNNNLWASLEIAADKIETDPNITSALTFVSTWDVWIDEWVSGFNNLKLPLQNNWIYDFIVDWWDWNIDIITEWDQIETTHNYLNNWIYNVKIDWLIDWFAFNFWSVWNDNKDDWDKLIDINNWWTVKLWKNWFQFWNVENLVSFSAQDSPDLSHVTSMNWMFANAISFNWDLSNFDTSNVTDMSLMFFYANSFNGNIDNFDTSKVTNMSFMFANAINFNQSVSSFDTSNVTDMTYIFADANNFNQSVSSFDTSKVTNMSRMFSSNYNFNQPVFNFDTSKVTSMHAMFYRTKFNYPLNHFDTSKVTRMHDMFSLNYYFNQDISWWNVWLVTNCSNFDLNTTAWTLPDSRPSHTCVY